eukprot:g16912.t1
MDKGENLCLEAENADEILNVYFELACTQEKDMEDNKNSVEHAKMLAHFEIKKEVTLDLLKSTKVDKSPEPKDIYSRLLRETRQEITGALTKIVVPSLIPGEVPEVANVPLFKKGNRNNPGNYRL